MEQCEDAAAGLQFWCDSALWFSYGVYISTDAVSISVENQAPFLQHNLQNRQEEMWHFFFFTLVSGG